MHPITPNRMSTSLRAALNPLFDPCKYRTADLSPPPGRRWWSWRQAGQTTACLTSRVTRALWGGCWRGGGRVGGGALAQSRDGTSRPALEYVKGWVWWWLAGLMLGWCRCFESCWGVDVWLAAVWRVRWGAAWQGWGGVGYCVAWRCCVLRPAVPVRPSHVVPSSCRPVTPHAARLLLAAALCCTTCLPAHHPPCASAFTVRTATPRVTSDM